MLCGDVEATIVGTEGPDKLTGTNGASTSTADMPGGDDVINASGGDDLVSRRPRQPTRSTQERERLRAFGDISFGLPRWQCRRHPWRRGRRRDLRAGKVPMRPSESPARTSSSVCKARTSRAVATVRDIAVGGPGNDTIHGDTNADILYGAFETTTIFGDDGADYLNGDLCVPARHVGDRVFPGRTRTRTRTSTAATAAPATTRPEWWRPRRTSRNPLNGSAAGANGLPAAGQVVDREPGVGIEELEPRHVDDEVEGVASRAAVVRSRRATKIRGRRGACSAAIRVSSSSKGLDDERLDDLLRAHRLPPRC